mmetsp:Transcript_109915/g.262071  ORF Transcript_109915/g.262071 Transcript_109915/m.262071 type:complete len:210 (-) Transcript_109915:249-878(-)
MATKKVSIQFHPYSGFLMLKNILPSAKMRNTSSNTNATHQVMSNMRKITCGSEWISCIATCVSTPKVADDASSVIITSSSKRALRTSWWHIRLCHGMSDSLKWKVVTDFASGMGVPEFLFFSPIIALLEKDTVSLAGASLERLGACRSSGISRLPALFRFHGAISVAGTTADCRRQLLGRLGGGRTGLSAVTWSGRGISCVLMQPGWSR